MSFVKKYFAELLISVGLLLAAVFAGKGALEHWLDRRRSRRMIQDLADDVVRRAKATAKNTTDLAQDAGVKTVNNAENGLKNDVNSDLRGLAEYLNCNR